MIKLRILRWGDLLELPGGPSVLRVVINRGKRMSIREWQCDDEERLE